METFAAVTTLLGGMLLITNAIIVKGKNVTSDIILRFVPSILGICLIISGLYLAGFIIKIP